MKRFVLPLFLLALASGCERDFAETAPQDYSQVEHSTFVAYTTPTKTDLSGLSIRWMETDAISVFNAEDGVDNCGNARYAAASVEGSSATFVFSPRAETSDWTNVNNQAEYVAVYPYRSVGTNAYDPSTKTITHRLPVNQSYVAGSFSNGVFPMAAISSNTNLYFKGVCGVLRLEMTGSAVISSIVVEADKIAGTGTIDMTEDNPVMVMDASATNKITYSCGGGVQLRNTPTEFNIVLPEATYTSLSLTITDKEHGCATLRASGLSIVRGQITPAPLAYVPKSMPADLSSSGKYANCYVVSGPGDYCFATRLPDGTAVEDIAGAKWIWATSGSWATQYGAISNFLKGGTVDYYNGRVYFSVPESHHYGNVVIGLVDSSDNLLYTYHLWITRPLADKVVAGHEVMDRNLGANAEFDANGSTDVNGSRGLFYQWGRKDPIPGPRGNSADGSAFEQGKTTWVNYNEGYGPWATLGDTKLATSVMASRYPLSMISAVANLPHVISGNTDPWSSKENANPCPYGYHVITSAEFAEIMDVSNTLVTNGSNAHLLVGGTLTFPRVGYRNGSSGVLTSPTTDGRYWTDAAAADNQGTWYQLKASSTSGGANRIHGAAVRCVKGVVTPDPVAPNISGHVLCGGSPVVGVPVTDGVSWTETAADGSYTLASDKKYGYVFIVTPSGYDPELSGGFPQFWHSLSSTDVGEVENIDFNLTSRDNDQHLMLFSADWHLAGRFNDANTCRTSYLSEIEDLDASSPVPVYELALGDLTWDSFWPTGHYYPSAWKAFNSSSGHPIYTVIGNHDYDYTVYGTEDDDLNASLQYRQALGPTFYSMNIGKVHYIVINDIRYSNTDGTTSGRAPREYVTAEQIEWMKEDLSRVNETTPVVLATHSAFYRYLYSRGKWNLNSLVSNAFDVLSVLSGFDDVRIFCGHRHVSHFVDHTFEGFPYAGSNMIEYTVPPVGGTLWTTKQYCGYDIGTDGCPSGYEKLYVNGKSMEVSFKSIGDSDDYQMRFYDMNKVRAWWNASTRVASLVTSDSSYSYENLFGEYIPNTVFINVFMADWKNRLATVEVFEDGVPVSVEHVAAFDPQHVASYDVQAFNYTGEVNDSFKSVICTHMFKVTASFATSTITAKVTDRDGHVYSGTMTRPKAFSETTQY